MRIRKFTHAALIIVGGIPWFFALLLMAVVAKLGVWADRVLPDASTGNCWSFVLPRVLKEGGYIAVRPAPDVAFFKSLLIPHAIWVKSIRGAEIAMTVPAVRKVGRLFPLHTFFFRYRVFRRDQAKVDPWRAG